MFNIVLIGIAKELPAHDEEYELHRLLSALFSEKLSVSEKLEIVETEYHIPIDERMKKEMSVMCNLGQGILELGEERGKAEMIIRMCEKDYPLEQIADISEKDIDEIKAIIESREPVPV